MEPPSTEIDATISSADWPGALARLRRYCVSRRVLAGNLGIRKLRVKLALRRKLGQPLLCGHTLGFLVKVAARSLGRSRFHGIM